MADPRARLAGALGVLALLAPTAVLATPTSAAAERGVLTDPAGDVVRTDMGLGEGEEDDGDRSFAPDEKGADVRRLVARHGRTSLTITMRYRDLTRGSKRLSTSFMIQAPREQFLFAEVTMGRERSGDRATFSSFSDEEPARCRGLRHEVSIASDTVRVTIPRRCLGRPAWVRVSGNAIATPFGQFGPSGPSEAPAHFWQDTAGADAYRPFSMPGQTRRIHAG